MTSDSVFIMVFQNITRSELNSRQSTAEHSLKYPVVFAFLLFVVINVDFIFLLQTRENEIGKSVCRSSAFSFFRRFRKMSKHEYYIHRVRPSVRPSAWNNLAPTGGIFVKFGIRIFFENVSLKSDKNNGYFTWRPIHFFDCISLSSS